MKDIKEFLSEIKSSYSFSGESVTLGSAVFNSEVVKELPVSIPLKTLNRHGLVSGATGTGKTKAIQHIAELLSQKGVPTLLMDIKGDISGISKPGVSNSQIKERSIKTGVSWSPKQFPVEFLTLTNSSGIQMRATVSEFGPILFSKILELNETQESIISLLFKFADDYKLPLVDLKDIKKLINFLTNEGKGLLEKDYGMISTNSIGIILRKIIELEGQGANSFFGEPSFDVNDLLRKDTNEYGVVSILRLMDLQNKPKLFSTFMLSLVAEIYAKFPEVGDSDKPKLVIMIDEAHLIFRDATKTLLKELETVIKLIRSKGVGIIFCTQLPTDIPSIILSQLGLKVQFALRAFTAADRKAIKLVSQNYPDTDFYNTEELITNLGIGEALITALNEKGNPTELVHTYMSSPESRMDVITDDELTAAVKTSLIASKYSQSLDSESAYEMLNKKIADALNGSNPAQNNSSLSSTLDSLFGSSMGKSVARSATTSLIGTLTRGVLGAIMKNL